MAAYSTSTPTEWKSALVQLFEGFSANQVSQHHVESARRCISQGGSRHERYTLIPFERILNDNQVKHIHVHVHVYAHMYIVYVAFVKGLWHNYPGACTRFCCRRCGHTNH